MDFSFSLSRSDFVTLPFQGAEVLLDNIAPLPGRAFINTVWHPTSLTFQSGHADEYCIPSGEDRFSAEATSALEEMTRGVPLLAQVSPPRSLLSSGVSEWPWLTGFVSLCRSQTTITTRASHSSICGTWWGMRYDASLLLVWSFLLSSLLLFRGCRKSGLVHKCVYLSECLCFLFQVILVNRTLAERGLGVWVEGFWNALTSTSHSFVISSHGPSSALSPFPPPDTSLDLTWLFPKPPHYSSQKQKKYYKFLQA